MGDNVSPEHSDIVAEDAQPQDIAALVTASEESEAATSSSK